jgi:molybdenum cofactor biosynthesis enzyme MoaA
MSCNLKCKHCGYVLERTNSTDTEHGKILDIIKYLHNENYLDKSLRIDIGGGEPSISKDLQFMVEFLLNYAYKIHINTNCAKYVNLFAKGVNDDLVSLTLTPDAGSKDVYIKIKGADFFDTVWNNIGKYMDSTTNNVDVKFILQQDNLSDIENMVKKCVEKKVRKVTIDMDLNIQKNDYKLYVAPIKTFEELLLANNIEVKMGGHIRQ